MALFRLRNVIAIGMVSCALAQQPTARKFTELEHLDFDTIRLNTGETLTFLATWIAPELGQMERVEAESGSYVRDANGKRVTRYPEKMLLRITVGKKTEVDGSKPLDFDSKLNAQELSSNLHFRLRIYEGLEYRLLEPVSAKIIGVPKDVPYDERIYLVEFSLKDIPIEDRLVIEALDPEDTRVTRFSVSMI
jgi:hypothetical protein